ncbi:MAG: NADH-quinone oxidoreductase subunit C [Ilumatobacteraceae bacterium]|nr:NADH-quinone oxidoreductase subunit C [Acidimicrobiales bacterium]MCB9392074.1 NADH-quinone oxidoreductase subunit C [Acidimicrobiaceae bacterium]
MADTADLASSGAPEPVTLHGCPLVVSFGQQVLFVPRDQYAKVVKSLLADGYEMVSDLTAVDYLQMPERTVPDGVVAERFEVVVNLLSLKDRQRLRVRVQVPADDASIPTLFDLYPGTEAMEREVYDMFGITFTDHPDLTRILMPEDWDGHPLRKDYEVGRIPVQFKGAPN